MMIEAKEAAELVLMFGLGAASFSVLVVVLIVIGNDVLKRH